MRPSETGRRGYDYVSGIAGDIVLFVRHRRAADAICDSYEGLLHQLDTFCVRHFPGEGRLSQAMVDSWCARRDTESAKSCATRVCATASLVRFLLERGLTDASVPTPPRADSWRRDYVPHAFTRDELAAFFAECDAWRPSRMPRVAGLRTRHTLPVFFRLLYSSGIRTCEARLPGRDDVDLGDGVPGISEGKGRSERLVAPRPSMAGIMARYDACMERPVPGRVRFFPNKAGTALSADWVCHYFSLLWSRVSDEHATACMLRHAYAQANIDALVGRGLGAVDDLTALSRSMGHTSPEVTARCYYHLAPSLARAVQEASDPGLEAIVPEVL